jgi:hypothetical protein
MASSSNPRTLAGKVRKVAPSARMRTMRSLE